MEDEKRTPPMADDKTTVDQEQDKFRKLLKALAVACDVYNNTFYTTSISHEDAVAAAITAYLTAIEGKTAWCFDMEKAPRDGTEILMNWSKSKITEVVGFDEECNCWRGADLDEVSQGDSWLAFPMPAPPREEK